MKLFKTLKKSLWEVLEEQEPFGIVNNQNIDYYLEKATMKAEKEIKEQSNTETKQLKAENESLKKQLENSVQLPCKVGDKVYTVYNHWNYPNQHFVQSHQVDKFMVWNKDTILTIAHTGNFGLRDLNKTWFLTKPEAEARLRELEAQND